MEIRDYEEFELEPLTDAELVSILQKRWELNDTEFNVWGELKPLGDVSWGYLTNVRVIGGSTILTYPLKGHNGNCEFFVNPKDASKYGHKDNSRLIRCQLILSPQEERKKHEIPFEMNVKPGSCSELKELPSAAPIEIINADDKSPYITSSLYDFHLNKIQEKLALATDELKTATENELNLLQAQRDEEESKRDSAITLNRTLSEKEQQLKDSIQLIETEKHASTDALLKLQNQLATFEVEMNQKIKRLKSYVSDKAQFLKTFEFIDEDDLENFLLESNAIGSQVDGLSFKDDFGKDYERAVSYIQAHLVENDILYPRHIIENYLTLLRTKDLIILAGDSGSGKTNLVKSFAKAVGGKSVIVPVKPNWTSREDLLGYYNPLEKKYLSTEFLDALLEARQNPNIPYFICLDEMNLARVEYYFADFLSLLETRDEEPEISLYSENESSHVLSELKAVVEIINSAKEKYSQNGITDFISLLQDEDVNHQLRQSFGFSDKDSLIKYHSDIRRMLSAVITMPSSIKMPENVHIIGAINIDETTHYLSPKILDRAHIMRFESPLLSDWDQILSEVNAYKFDELTKPLLFDNDELGIRMNYPKFKPGDEFTDLFIELNRNFFHKLGVEFGMRTIRQGLHYLTLFKDVNDDKVQALNNFLLHKVLPKFTFDGNKTVGQTTKLDLIEKVLAERIRQELPDAEEMPSSFSALYALEEIVINAKSNDGVVNFWS
ncbi:McrB family protein [Alteromonas hispanica]|uniref:AAA domain-containing protein n=1 Tax=Alteromonas hispanica TaxID=315421 RepID=A0A6L9MR65_9ALTE|nr:AAA family ATPase [Alteromonas hispanica]NDW20383.1 AAA domain-containing protein [Alteromonas hispanica]